MTSTKTPAPRTAADLEPGNAVTGTYMGEPFAGVVTHTRSHTINWSLRLTHVDLTEPFTLYGMPRTSLCVTTAQDGSRYTDARGFDSECEVHPA